MPPIGNQHVVGLGYRDATNEVGSFEMNVGAITAVSIAGFLTQFGAFQTATDAITLGIRARQHWTGDRTVVSNAIPTDPAAQREAKLFVRYMDDVTQEEFHVSVPTVDYSKLVFMPEAKDAVAFAAANGAHADIVAWVTAFEALGRSPRNDQNTVTITGMRFVGRNS